MADNNDQIDAKAPEEIRVCKGIVKAVTDGNRLIVRGPMPAKGLPQERIVIISGIRAPACGKESRSRLAESTQVTTTEDQPGAFLAREFVRNMFIGKAVKFSIQHAWENIPQVAGNVWMADQTPGNPAHLGVMELGLKAGWYKVSEQNKYPSATLTDYELHAQNNDLGVNSEAGRLVRDLSWDTASIKESQQLVAKHRGKKLKGQVEFVLSGSTLKVYLAEFEHYVVVQLTGLVTADKKQFPDLAAQAKFFVESRLLHRDVEITLDFADEKEKRPINATILHPKGNISEMLLAEGFAKCSDWTIKYYPQNVKSLRNAQNTAKSQRKRVWKDYKAPTEGMSITSFNALVKQIRNTDTVIVENCDTKVQQQITLASTRALNKTDFGDVWAGKIAKLEKEKAVQKIPFSPVTDIPVNFEAKEFMRKKLIGKKVRVTVDYKQEAAVKEIDGRTMSFPARICATVHLGEVNIAEAMVSRGYLKLITHGMNDDNRSSEYDVLAQAEVKARDGSKGVHSKTISLPKIHDINTKEKAQPFLSSFQRTGSVVAIVDYVFSANRLKCYIPKDNINCMCILAGIEAPRQGRMIAGKREGGEPYAAEAAAFTADHILQQEVTLKVEGTDKYGSLIAYANTQKHDNMSVLLCQEGFAKVHFSADRSIFGDILAESEQKAKEARKNIWTAWTPADDEDEDAQGSYEENANSPQIKQEGFNGCVSDISAPNEETSAITISVQKESAQAAIEKVQNDLNAHLTENPPLSGSFAPKRGQVIAAKWNDGLWYRAKVEKLEAGMMTVLFVDFGNVDKFAILGKVAALPAPVDLSLLRAQAQQFELAFVGYPKSADWADLVFGALNDTFMGQLSQVKHVYNKFGAPQVTLCEANGDNIVKMLISGGECMVVDDKRCPDQAKIMLNEFKAAEKEAMRGHKMIWRYGDMKEDAAPEFASLK